MQSAHNTKINIIEGNFTAKHVATLISAFLGSTSIPHSVLHDDNCDWSLLKEEGNFNFYMTANGWMYEDGGEKYVTFPDDLAKEIIDALDFMKTGKSITVDTDLIGELTKSKEGLEFIDVLGNLVGKWNF